MVSTAPGRVPSPWQTSHGPCRRRQFRTPAPPPDASRGYRWTSPEAVDQQSNSQGQGLPASALTRSLLPSRTPPRSWTPWASLRVLLRCPLPLTSISKSCAPGEDTVQARPVFSHPAAGSSAHSLGIPRARGPEQPGLSLLLQDGCNNPPCACLHQQSGATHPLLHNHAVGAEPHCGPQSHTATAISSPHSCD